MDVLLSGNNAEAGTAPWKGLRGRGHMKNASRVAGWHGRMRGKCGNRGQAVSPALRRYAVGKGLQPMAPPGTHAPGTPAGVDPWRT